MKRVRETLTKLDGVTEVEIDFDAKTATITHRGELAKATLDKAFEGSRYGVKSLETRKSEKSGT